MNVFPDTVLHALCSHTHLIDKKGHVRLLTCDTWDQFPDSALVSGTAYVISQKMVYLVFFDFHRL